MRFTAINHLHGFFESSAKSGYNVESIFLELSKLLYVRNT